MSRSTKKAPFVHEGLFKKIEEITSQTDRMRLTGEIGRFYTDLLPYIKSVNIIIFSINHIKVNPQMGIVKSPAELLYLKQDEALGICA